MADTWLPVLVEMPLTKDGKDPGPPFIVNCGYTHTAVVCGAGRLYTCGWEREGSSGSSYSSLVFDRFPAKRMARDGDNTLSSYNQHGNHPIQWAWDREANSAHVL